MAWKKYKHILIACSLASLVSFFLVYLASNNFFGTAKLQKPIFTPAAATSQDKGERANERKLLFQEYYAVCEHTITKEKEDIQHLDGLSVNELQQTFSQEEGWTVYEAGDYIILSRQIEDLCPEDAKKRHLGAYGDYVAIIRGPVGIDGGVVSVTDVRIDSLPRPWQQQVREGTLNFGSVEELLEALDSLDEYRSR
ncbi:hypothetical protein [Calderihabitans maritimus]|uniref:Bypass of forespore C C-terminal domain-containing protein n=1 Tax=Calderihabitans maritimus TaxID=1246530 RepID=A0A1Z5HT79_9FIRM|nr:hypothetical protein [Calderihabitans maritimus]GAW92724.1 hypothetical protein Slip_0740 [Calderihabitans maritimus]